MASEEVELERLVVRLVGDQTLVDKMVKGVAKEMHSLDEQIKEADKALKQLENDLKAGEAVMRSVENATEKYERELQELDEMFQKGTISQETFSRAVDRAYKEYSQASIGLKGMSDGLKSYGSNLSLYVTAPLTGLGVLALREFSNMETTSLRLDAALESNGRAVGSLGKQYRNFAADIQKRTKTGDDDVINLLQQAESLGITGDAAQRAAKNALGLAAAKKIGAESAIRMTIALEQGNASLLNRHIPALRAIKDPTEKAAKAQEILAGMFKVAEAEAKSFDGQLAQLKNDFGDFMEEVGAVIAE